MMEWTVVVVIISLVGLLTAVVKPVISLTQSITKLTTVVDVLAVDVGELTSKNTQTHNRIFDKLEKQGEDISNHETRISLLEHTGN